VDGGTWRYLDKGARSAGPQLVPAKALRKEPGSQYVSFPYAAFETAFLSWFHELTEADLVGTDDAPEDDIDDRLEVVEGRLADVVQGIANITARLVDDPSNETFLNALAKLDSEKAALTVEAEQLREELHSPSDDRLEESQGLVDALTDVHGEKLTQLRTRLKAGIRELVEGIWLVVQVDGHSRQAYVQIHFKGGGARKLFINHTVTWEGGGSTNPRPVTGFAYTATERFKAQKGFADLRNWSPDVLAGFLDVPLLGMYSETLDELTHFDWEDSAE
jgi:hypothetical protein